MVDEMRRYCGVVTWSQRRFPASRSSLLTPQLLNLPAADTRVQSRVTSSRLVTRLVTRPAHSRKEVSGASSSLASSSLAWMFRSRSDPFDDVPQHCRPDRPAMFAVSRAPFPWETSGGAQDQHPPATDARAGPLVTESAPSAWCFGPATPPKAAAPTRPAALPAPRAAVAAAPLVQAAPRQADSLPQPASASPGPQQPTDPSQQPTDQSRRRKMLRPRCASGPAAPAAHAWAVETCVDMHMHMHTVPNSRVPYVPEDQSSLLIEGEPGTYTHTIW